MMVSIPVRIFDEVYTRESVKVYIDYATTSHLRLSRRIRQSMTFRG